MNLEVLWASYALTGNQTLINIANAHANTTMINHFREDGGHSIVDYFTPIDLRIVQDQLGML